ncbi:MAG: ABC transporter permease [Acidobacteriaceae bacterium]
MNAIKNAFKEFSRYPSAIFGMVIIVILILVSIYALISLPYQKAITLWRAGEGIWYQNPRFAAPVWTNFFRKEKLPETIVQNTLDGTASKTFTAGEKMDQSVITFTFDYPYGDFPQDIAIYFTARYAEKQPYASLYWLTPDARNIRIADFAVDASEVFYISQDTKLQRRLSGLLPQQGIFVADPKAGLTPPVKGTYQLVIDGLTFEKDSSLDAEMVLYGKVHGIAGTDQLRRDLRVALLWGTPVALAFGLLAALGTTLITMVISAFGVWYGGWVDGIIQRITEVNVTLPFLSILIMVGTFYSRSLVTILGVTVLLSIFGYSIKSYRSVFLQVKESPYIEAARAYGAGGNRIIFSYLVPRIIPLLIPALVIAIPGYVFLEASLAVLGLGDPTLPTWGKVMSDAFSNGALYKGLYYWVLEPAALLMLSGLAFALLGFSLDRIFNPRLRGI